MEASPLYGDVLVSDRSETVSTTYPVASIVSASLHETQSALTAHVKVPNYLKTTQRETRSVTSDLILSDGPGGQGYVNEPDLTYYCESCQIYINLGSMKDHKAYHWALRIMQYSEARMPKDVADLSARRQFLIKFTVQQKKVEEFAKLDFINKLNKAYELLKQDLEDTYEQYRKVKENIDCAVQALSLKCSVKAVTAVGVCSTTNARWKSENEDARVFQDYFGNDPNKAFLAIYDGHNGRYAAAMAANELHYLLLKEMKTFDSKVNCVCTFNMLELNDISHYSNMALNTTSVVASHGGQNIVHQESTNDIHQIIYTCNEATLAEGHKVAVSTQNGSSQPLADVKTDGLDWLPKGKMKEALRKAYEKTDVILSYGKDEKSRVRWSGTSALTCVIEDVRLPAPENAEKTGKEKQAAASIDTTRSQSTALGTGAIAHIHLANAGNVQAVLVQDNGLWVISKMHTAASQKERTRVESAGGFFSDSNRDLRVNGVLPSTRGLGNHGDPRLKQCISSEPFVTTVEITNRAQFLILASNGIWDVLTPHEAADILLQMLPSNRVPTPGDVSPSVFKLLRISENSQPLNNGSIRSSLHSTALGSHTAKDDQIEPAMVNLLALPHSTTLGSKTKDYLTGHDTPSGSGAAVAKEKRDSATAESARRADVLSLSSMIVRSNSAQSGEVIDGGVSRASSLSSTSVTAAAHKQLQTTSNLNTSAHFEETSAAETLAKGMAERLAQAALLAGSKDNITILITLFPSALL